MYLLLPVALFAAYASAQLTTAAWYIRYSSSEVTGFPFAGSVVELNGDRTTMAVTIAHSGSTQTKNQTQDTITLGGITYAGFTVTALYPNRNPSAVVEVLECTRSNEDLDASATCVFSAVGASESAREDCNRYSRSELRTTTITITRPSGPQQSATVWVETSTQDYRSNAPDYCTDSTIPEDAIRRTRTFPGGSDRVMQTYGLILTAGLEKLEASAVSTPTRSGDNPTQTAAESTGAAAPMRTTAPALAGMGAAVAAFFL